jgi:hypothetical protein
MKLTSVLRVLCFCLSLVACWEKRQAAVQPSDIDDGRSGADGDATTSQPATQTAP